MKILLGGCGKMAQVMEAVCAARGVVCERFEVAGLPTQEDAIAVYFGSGRELLALAGVCEQLGVPLIQGSTKVESPSLRNLTLINAPNLSIPMVRLMDALPAFLRAVGIGMSFSVAESHQSGKKDVSGTARAIAGKLGVPEEDIVSIRDPALQQQIGVPSEHLDGHAYHNFALSGYGVGVHVMTRVHGRATYAEGALAVAQALLNLPEPLKPGTYHLPDILPILFPPE